MWRVPSGYAHTQGGHLFLPVGERVAVYEHLAPLELVAGTSRGLIRNHAGRWIVFTDDAVLEMSSTARTQREILAGTSLPEGARRARRFLPLPDGPGAVWADGGWVYRKIGHGSPRPVAAIRGSEHFTVGPSGALCIGGIDPDCGLVWTRAIGSIGSPVALARYLSNDGLRWSADGQTLFALCVDGNEPVEVDLSTGVAHPLAGSGVFLSAEEWLNTELGVLTSPQGLQFATTGCVALSEEDVHGPGLRSWDLQTGAPKPDVIGEPGDYLVTVAKDLMRVTSDGVVFSTARSPQSLPLQLEDEVLDVWSTPKSAFCETAAGDTFDLKTCKRVRWAPRGSPTPTVSLGQWSPLFDKRLGPKGHLLLNTHTGLLVKLPGTT